MALVLANRVQESATANTTVSFTLTGAVLGFQTFAVIGDTNATFYSATDSSGNWEVGLGTYSSTGPTLTRTTIYASSNTGSAVTFSGPVNVFVTYPSGKSVNLDASGNVSALGTVSSGTWQGSTIGVAYGGTGVTTSSGANSVVLRDANQNITVNRLNQANTDVTAAGGTTALTAASSYSQTLIGTGSQTFTMPDATTLTTGVAFVFNNNATGTVTLQDYASGSIGTITSGGAAELVLLANGTVAGTWDVHGFLPENVTWGTNALNMGSTVVSGGTWQGGTIQPAYGGTGLTSFVGANNALYSTGATTLTAGTLPVAAGGTGLTTFTGANNALYSTSSSALTAGTLPVAAGGTGATSQTAYAVLCGGTTSTGAYQSIASVGTAGQVLTSNGAGALPTFQDAGGGFAAGTRLIFAQDAAPTGWTKDTTNYNNHALRVVTGTAGTTGGSVDFTTAFASQTPSGSVSVSVSGTVGSTTLATSQIPSHSHSINTGAGFTAVLADGCNRNYFAGGNTGAQGGGGSHNHSFSGSGSGSFSGNAINLAVKYLNVITATKN